MVSPNIKAEQSRGRLLCAIGIVVMLYSAYSMAQCKTKYPTTTIHVSSSGCPVIVRQFVKATGNSELSTPFDVSTVLSPQPNCGCARHLCLCMLCCRSS
jgi:hypothetical protein